jgi:hypothetical protein
MGVLMAFWISFFIAVFFSGNILANPETREFEASGLTEVKIENTSGRVSLTSSEDQKVSVSATKNKFSDKCKMTIDKVGQEIHVKVESKGFLSTDECDVDFDIKAPKGLDLDVTNGSGDVSVFGSVGDFEFEMGSGRVTAEGNIKSIDGDSGSGPVNIKGLTGGGEIKTGSGSIDLTFAKSPLAGNLDLDSGSSDATLLFPKDSLVKTKFKSGSGELTNEIGDSPNASFEISMKSGSGSLKVKTY